MLNQNYIAKLLDLEDVIVTNVENSSAELFIEIELPRKAHICPDCGCMTDRVHDYRKQVVKDVPLGRDTYLILRKRRYRCLCGKRFFEENTFLPRYYRATRRLVAAIITSFENVLSAKELGRRYNVSGVTAMRCFHCFNRKPMVLPEVLSIDEFKGNSGGEKYNTILVDPQNKRVLDVLPNRYENDLIQYFKQFDSRNNVKHFICDMNPHFRNVSKACFPKAKVVADRYHVIRQVCWAMENVRKNEQKKLSGRFRRYFKRSRSLLMKKWSKLTPDEMDALALMFEIAPRLADAYRLKNDFLTVMRAGSSQKGRELLSSWLWSAELMDIPEFQDCTKAYRSWFDEILNSLDVPWTNGYIEGCNNKTKVLKRTCYGLRNFDNFRKRILFCNP